MFANANGSSCEQRVSRRLKFCAIFDTSCVKRGELLRVQPSPSEHDAQFVPDEHRNQRDAGLRREAFDLARAAVCILWGVVTMLIGKARRHRLLQKLALLLSEECPPRPAGKIRAARHWFVRVRERR